MLSLYKVKGERKLLVLPSRGRCSTRSPELVCKVPRGMSGLSSGQGSCCSTLLVLERDPTSHRAEEHISRGGEHGPTQEDRALKRAFEPGGIDGSL